MYISQRCKYYVIFAIFVVFVLLLIAILDISPWFAIVFFIVLLAVAIYDFLQKKHALLRNFPIIGHVRFVLEFFHPLIQKYFIANDYSEGPFNRWQRNIVYKRASNKLDSVAFGTDKNIDEIGYEWVTHSLIPKEIDQVESRVTIGGPYCKKPYKASLLNISAMGFGPLSANAVMALNKGAALGGFYQNVGEDGLTDYHLQGGDLVYQIGTGYFGCRTSTGNFCPKEFAKKVSIDTIKMIEIKLSQGARPSRGGMLPAHKVTAEIAQLYNIELGKDIVSPPTHSAFNTPIEFCNFIKQLRDLSGGKPIGFKLCIGEHSEFLAICKAMLKTNITPDFITVDSSAGGTGAAPVEFVDRVGMPLEDSLIFVHNALVGCGLRKDIRIIASGKVVTGFDMVRLFALGADICNSARAMMLAIGCQQFKQCHNNTCPVGIATQNANLSKALDVDTKKHNVYNFHSATIKAYSEIIAAMGLTAPNQITPEKLKKRISVNSIRSYAHLYDFVPENCLIDGNIPPSFIKSWQRAQADSF